MPVKILIVDDSATCRALLKRSLQNNPNIIISGTASTPEIARDMIIQDQPDVISLDVEMPGMNGLQFLEKIMRRRPIPVVMTSSLTQKGADIAITALQMGAFDCFFKKETSSDCDPFEGLDQMLIAASKQNMAYRSPSKTANISQVERWERDEHLIVIGASTGGVDAIEKLLAQLPNNILPIVIVQHMPAMFVKSFAARLNHQFTFDIAPSRNGEILKKGQIRIAMCEQGHIAIQKSGSHYMIRNREGTLVSGHRPSVDILFASAARTCRQDAIGIILTGMGSDGAQGLLEMKNAGALTIGEDRASAKVYGMPRAAKMIGAVQKELPLHQIANCVCRRAA